MITLKSSEVVDKISHLINRNVILFDSFENVYLFGSILNVEKTPNDIDMLLIYKEYSMNLMHDLNRINSAFEDLNELPVDITVLSIGEEKNTKFIKKLGSRYLKLK